MFDTTISEAGIPRGLSALEPGPRLGAILSTVDVERLSGRDAVEFAKAQHRQIAYDQSREYRALSRVGDAYADILAEFAPAEVGAALTYTRRTADREMAFAYDVVHQYPTLLQALEQGQIDVAKGRVIAMGVGHTRRGIANAAIEQILPVAGSLTTGQIAMRIRRIVIEADPEAAKTARRQAQSVADVWSTLEPDGTGTMVSRGMDPYDLSRANRNINGMARKMKNEGDTRPIGLIRSEVFAGLLTGDLVGTGSKAEVNITGSLSTLTGLDELPGDLDGFGPVAADILRRIVREQSGSTWTYEVRDEETGHIFVGTTARRPTTRQKRSLFARYPTCVHPGCRMPSRRCDIDHIEDWARGGPTRLGNLAPLCRYHHRLKHQAGWHYQKRPDGTIQWKTRLNQLYATHPP